MLSPLLRHDVFDCALFAHDRLFALGRGRSQREAAAVVFNGLKDHAEPASTESAVNRESLERAADRVSSGQYEVSAVCSARISVMRVPTSSRLTWTMSPSRSMRKRFVPATLSDQGSTDQPALEGVQPHGEFSGGTGGREGSVSQMTIGLTISDCMAPVR